MALLHRFAPGPQLLEFPLRWAGAALAVVSFVFGVFVTGHFRRSGTTLRPFEESTTLLQRGPYRFSRNPIYLGMVVGLTGFAILFGSLTPFFVIPVFALIIHFRIVRAEEAMLERTFGAAYADYKRRVRRWV